MVDNNVLSFDNNENILSKVRLDKQSKWIEIDFFGKLLSIICRKYENCKDDKGIALYKDVFNKDDDSKKIKNYNVLSDEDKKSFTIIDTFKKIDPLTLISYFSTSAKPSIRQNRLKDFFQNFKPKEDDYSINLFNELKNWFKDILNNNYLPKTTFWDNVKNYKKNFNETIDKLWKFAIELNKVKNDNLGENSNFINAFKDIIPDINIKKKAISGIKISNLSTILYLCKPNQYYPLDSTMFDFIKDNYKNINIDKNEIKDFNNHCSYKKYSEVCKELRELNTSYSLYKEAINYKNRNMFLVYINDYFYKNKNRNENSNKNEIINEPVCREERQYALFLYNRLLNMVDKKFETLSIDDQHLFRKIFNQNKKNIKILRVYYEVSFLRDFFKKGNLELKDYLNFNKKLYDYVLSIFYDDKEKHSLSKLFESIIQYHQNLPNFNDEYEKYLPSKNSDIFNSLKSFLPLSYRNYGSITKKDVNNIKDIPSFVIKLMQTMMNSKPDIGIIYEIQRKKYLKFIECKYISREGSTNLLDINCDNKNKKDLKFPYILRQTHIQYYIADFVCKELIGNNRIEADIPLLLKFINKSKENDSKEDNFGDYYFKFDSNDSIKTEYIILTKLVPNCFKNKLFD